MKHLVISTCLLVSLLLEASGANLDESLLNAVDRGDVAETRKALQTGAKVDLRNNQGRTPLMIAANAGHFDVATILVDKGADVNARTPTQTGSSVLAFAVGGKNLKTIDYLISHGAELDLKSRDGSTPLCHAAVRGETEIVALLLSKGADPNLYGMHDSTGNYNTPLMIAANSNHVETMKLLLSKGAKIDRRSNKGNTPLMEASKRPYELVVKFLIEKGSDVNAKGPHGHTALIFAAYNGHIKNIKLLLAAGADPFATATDDPDPDKEYGRYGAETLASQQGYPEAVALIVEAQSRARPVGVGAQSVKLLHSEVGR
jgi:ankyrin repeat protein